MFHRVCSATEFQHSILIFIAAAHQSSHSLPLSCSEGSKLSFRTLTTTRCKHKTRASTYVLHRGSGFGTRQGSLKIRITLATTARPLYTTARQDNRRPSSPASEQIREEPGGAGGRRNTKIVGNHRSSISECSLGRRVRERCLWSRRI
jgi:hypothetical protein